MDRMEKMLERIESRQQKADSETKSVYTTVSTGISYLRGQVTLIIYKMYLLTRMKVYCFF
jgi:hypothetical protein